MGMMAPVDAAPAPLTLDDAAFRRLGYAVVDLLADHWSSQDAREPVRVGAPGDLRARLARPAPEQGFDPKEVLAELVEHVLPHVQHGDHPRFFARIPGPSNPVGAIADFLASGLNVFAGSWTGGSGPAAVELVVLDWLRELCGLPEGTEGAFVSGGSVATLDALAAAGAAQRGRPAARAGGGRPRGGARPGGGPEAVLRRRDGGNDEHRRRRPARRARRRLPRRRAVAARRRRLRRARRPHRGRPGTPAGHRARGLGRRRPAQWLFQPYECGVLLVRRAGALAWAFALHPEYLADVAGDEGAVNFFNRGVQLTRGFRALKLWMTIRTFGMAALREAVERGMGLAVEAEAMLRERGWRIVTPAQPAIVSFRRHEPGLDAAASARRHARVVAELQRDGTAAISSTVLGGETVLRLCTINPRTTSEDLRLTIDALERCWKATAR